MTVSNERLDQLLAGQKHDSDLAHLLRELKTRRAADKRYADANLPKFWPYVEPGK